MHRASILRESPLAGNENQCPATVLGLGARKRSKGARVSYSIRSPQNTATVFDPLDYVSYLRSRWRVVAIAGLVAVSLTLGISLLLPKRFTSTASIVIEPPLTTDPRTLMAISPMYLESLKTYELYATSDTLFLRALDRFHLREEIAGQAIESFKRRVLKVAKLRDTKVMQIGVTLGDPKAAQEMAQFLAEETVKLSSAVSRDSGKDAIEEAKRQTDVARADLNSMQEAWNKASSGESVESLRSELDAMVELLYRLRRTISEDLASAAEYASKAQALTAPDGAAKTERENLERQAASMNARVAIATAQAQALEQNLATKNRVLAERSTAQSELEGKKKTAQASYDAALKRLQELQTAVSASGDRLRIIDPGIVPDRPSEPRIVLNCAVALGVALLGCLIYLSFAFGMRT